MANPFPYEFPILFREFDGGNTFRGGSLITSNPNMQVAEIAKYWRHPVEKMRRKRNGRNY